MPTLYVTDRSGDTSPVETQGKDLTVMEVIRDGGFEELLALCEGGCACATCHVYVGADHEAALPPISADEDDLLSSLSYRTAQSRLSCQISFESRLKGLAVTIAPEE